MMSQSKLYLVGICSTVRKGPKKTPEYYSRNYSKISLQGNGMAVISKKSMKHNIHSISENFKATSRNEQLSHIVN